MDTEIQRILALEVPVIVQIGERSLSVGEVMSLTPGSIIEMPKSCDDELDLCINNKVLGAGVAVKVGENFGIRLTYLGNLEERVEGLGESLDSSEAGLTDLAQGLLGDDD